MQRILENDREVIAGATEAEWLELRTHDITSTDAAALFGLSSYCTPYELWHRKKTRTNVAYEEQEWTKWGKRLQDSIATGICEDEGWKDYRRKDEYVRWLAMRMGASFDFEVMHGGEMPLLEIKNVGEWALRQGWLIDGNNIEAPPHIELQVQCQLAVANRKRAYIGALVGGNRVVLIHRDRDDAIINALTYRVKQFWESIDKNREPQPDFQKDADFISKLYRYATPGKVLNAEGNELLTTLTVNYKKAGDAAKILQAEKDGYKAQMLTIIGDAEKVIGNGFTVSAGLIGPKEISYMREGYRDFRLFQKKAKEVSHA